MTEDDPVHAEILVRGQRCTVTAVKHRGTRKATGTFRGVELTAYRAATATQAFEWWTNQAEMQQMAGHGQTGDRGLGRRVQPRRRS